jgi:hypothetical protein
MSEIAFHEKAGGRQVDSCLFLLGTFSSPPSGHCRHASIRTLEERFVSLGAHWAFSVQPVLPSVWRPCGSTLGEWNLGQAINAVTGTRLWLLSFLFLERFCFYAAAATVVGLLLCNGSYTSPLTHR